MSEMAAMFRSIREAQNFSYRPLINWGGCRPLFFQFEGALSPAPEVEAIDVVMSSDAKEGAIVGEYIEAMRDAFHRAAESHADDDRLCSVRAIITRMICHPVDTNLQAVQKRSAEFVDEMCRGRLTQPLPPLDDASRTETVTGLARSIRTDRAFDRLPILADALEEAGCGNQLVLAHCRGCESHGSRCWVIDWVLTPAQSHQAVLSGGSP